MKRICLLVLAFVVMTNIEAQNVVNDTVGRPRVGVVLCGGGAKGFAHIRILKKIEEAGIPIDYIGGTSIGSIIGGLYAVGYDPDMMEELVRKQDWNTIIYDKIPDRMMPIEDKMENAKYITTMQVKHGKVKVGESLVDGVYVNLLLSRLMLPARGVTDFRQLPVPFFCMGTDIEKACEYEMNGGSLSRSIRASMAIPFFFRPIRYDNRLLIDGGMVNNFPVRNMQEKGLDIIIGIDLEDYNIAADSIDSSVSLLTNMMNLSSLEQTEYGRQNCDIYIRPDLHGRNMMSFGDFDSILIYGEQAAESMFPRLKRLGDSLHSIADFEVVRPHVQPVDSLYVTDIDVRCLSDAQGRQYVRREFGKVFPSMMSVDDIERAVLRLKASGSFDDLWYEVVGSHDDGDVIVLHGTEKTDQSFSFAIHFDSDYGIGALVNYSLLGKGNRFKRHTFDLDVNVAETPYVHARITKRDGRFFRHGAEFYSTYMKLDQFDDSKITNSYRIRNYKFDVFTQYTESDIQTLRLGAAGEFFHIEDRIGNFELDNDYEFYPYLFMHYYLNSEDLTAYARRGWKINTLLKCIFSDHVSWSFQADVQKTVYVARRHSLKFGGVLGSKFGPNSVPKPYLYFVGGQSKMQYFNNIIPFYGMKFIEDVVNYATYAKMAWQWNIYRELYSVLTVNLGYMNNNFDQWFDQDSFVIGTGLTFGLNTFAGPIELSMSTSNVNSSLVGFLNVGYWF
ncbi:MAG: patatin-like phospholipase family protein [Bacteroidales bacterium]|nr:patatin-like phospholipase family protein [Bacteroidales bacterium]